MKKALLLLAFLAFCAVSSAQISAADSTVQTIAYFDIGERYEYTFTTEKYRISGTDTLPRQKLERDVVMTVVDSTEVSYDIELRFLNYKSDGGYEIDRFYNMFMSDLRVLYRTDELGAFEEILNLDEIYGKIDDFLLVMEMEIGEDYSAMETVLAPISGILKNRALIETTLQKFPALFHYFHGSSYTLGEVYSAQFEQEIPMVNNAVINRELLVWLDGICEEDGYYTVCAEEHFDAEQLKAISLDFVSSFISDGEDRIDEARNVFSELQMDNEAYVEAAIHNWGWVLYILREVVVGSGNQIAVEENIIEMK